MKKINDVNKSELFQLLSGCDGWKTKLIPDFIDEITLADGPNGLRLVYEEIDCVQKAYKSTAYPTLSSLSCSWNKEVLFSIGQCIAEDCIKKEVDIILGPGVNIKRTPLCGRNFEYVSEDPYLAGTLAAGYIEGVQSKGIGACLKHFCANNREYDRFYQSSEIDERALHEIYLRPFELAIKAKPWTMMCSYNPVNGIYTSESKKLLNDVLREKLGYKGLIMSDWGAVRNRAKSLKATIDLAMPFSPAFEEQLKEAYEKKFINDDEINFAVNNMLNLKKNIDETSNLRKAILTEEDKHAICVKAAEESIVLLKNENILPLENGDYSIAVIGSFAEHPAIGGEGSAKIISNYEDYSLTKKLSKKLTNCTIQYEPGYIIRYNLLQPNGYKNSIKLAYNSDKVILCIGNNDLIEKEETDRLTYDLQPQIQDLIYKICEVNSNVILAVYAGSAVNLTDFVDITKAIIYCGFAGEGVNDALANILTGDINPSGKITETFPMNIEDTYCEYFTGDSFTERYTDGVFVGYRYFDKVGINVTFPFGYGLSYSSFEYSNLKVVQLTKTSFEISYDITNTSKRPGKEISQIYVGNRFSMVSRPNAELVGYSKDLINGGETKNIKIVINDEAFRYYSSVLDNWYIENGTYEVKVGSSSRDIKLECKIEIKLDDYEQYSNR